MGIGVSQFRSSSDCEEKGNDSRIGGREGKRGFCRFSFRRETSVRAD